MPSSSVHQARRSKNGVKIGFCRVCTCEFKISFKDSKLNGFFFKGFNLNFLTSRSGLLKIVEVVLGSCCESLLIRFGMPAAQDIGENLIPEEFLGRSNRLIVSGEAFFSFHSTVTACLSTSMILLFSYFFSSKTHSLIRQSVFVSSKFLKLCSNCCN